VTLVELTEAYIRARLDNMIAKPVKKPKPVAPPKPKIVVMPPVKSSLYDVDRIIAAVAIAYNVTPEEIRGRSRKKNIAWVRHHVTWELYTKRSDLSLVTIAVVTNRVCHTSVINSVDAFKKNMHRFEKEIARVESELAPPPVVNGA
jgi:hypothetical protein